MSEKTDLRSRIEATIAQFPDKADQEIAELVIKEDGSHPTRSYVAKLRKKMGVTPTEKEAKEAEIKVEKEEVEVPEISEEPEAPPEAPAEEEEVAEDDKTLRPIFARSLGKFLNETIVTRLLKLKEKIADQQTLDDLEILLVINLRRLVGLKLEGDALLYATDISFFGGISLNAIIAKHEQSQAEKAKREAEVKREQERQAAQSQPPSPTPPPEQPPRVFEKGETVPPFMKGKIGLEAIPDMEAEQ